LLCSSRSARFEFFFFPAEGGIRVPNVNRVQTCALPISFYRYSCFYCRQSHLPTESGSWTTEFAAVIIAIDSCYVLPAALNDDPRSEDRSVGNRCGFGRGELYSTEKRW